MKRNTLVIAIVVVVLGIMGWAGYQNYQHRKQEQARLKEAQVSLTKLPPPSAQPDGSDAEPMTSPLTGKMAPDFTLRDTTGKKIALSSLKGKAIIIDFWATWCAPCKVEIPWLTKLYEQYSGQGLEILGVSEDDLDLDDKAKLMKEKQDIADSAKKLGINYPVLIDDNHTDKPYGGIDALPTTFFVDRDGKIVAATIGLASRDEIEANIRKALGSQPTAGGQ